jgi:4,5-dihydroxyphthalate decarboxylase
MKKQETRSTVPVVIEKDGTSRLHLSIAVNDNDHLRDLVNGVVRPDGIVLTPQVLQIEEIFYRFTKHLEWDVSEMSLAKYVSLTAAGNAGMTAIPVFPSRVFRHSALYVHKDGGIRDPRELQGKTVGVPEWAQTAGVYVRGLLAEYYGVDLRSISWVQAGVNQAGRKEKVTLSLPAGINYSPRQDKSLNDMLVAGEIDAIISARPPLAYDDAGSDIVRLFSDPRAEEGKHYQETGIFPIMHVIAMRSAVFESQRWIAMSLYKAFDESKQRSLARLKDITASGIPLPWQTGYVEEVVSTFGEDFWPYGIERNRPTLEAFCRYAHEQGVAGRRLAVEELFPEEVHAGFKV